MTASAKLQIGAALAALLLVSLLVMRVSSAAFTATTDTTGNWSSGSVALSDDDGATASFSNASGMVPGDSDQACIIVTYDGDVATAGVKMYGSTSFGSATDLGDHLTLTIEDVTIGALEDCATATINATLFSGNDLSVSTGAFTVAHTSFADGLGTGWTPTTNGEAKTYRITLELQDNDGAQGLDTNATFTWETQNA